MVQPSSDGVVGVESQEGQVGGVVIGSLEEVQPKDTRRPSLSSTMSDDSVGSSLTSGHSSTGSIASDSDIMSNGDAGGRGVGDMDGGGGAEPEGGRSKRSLTTSGEEQPVVQPSSQLRKACDLCTKRKRKCNGQHPCSQCIETGMRSQCVYSPRLKSGRKKKVRIDGVLYEEGSYGGELALVTHSGARRQAVDPSAGRFSASGAVGLAGHVENFFLATYLRDFNRIVPLTTESSVTEGMLEVLSPAVSSRGLATANPIKQPESRRQAKLAVFWGVVAMGSRILGATDDATVRYLGLMRNALRECFDCNDKEVVQAYLLLSTVETMRGNEAAGKRYLDHAHTMHNGNAMGPEGKLLRNRSEQDESLDLVFQIYDQPDGCVGGFNRSAAVGGEWRKSAALSSSTTSPPAAGSGGMAAGEPSSAVDQMIAQAMAPPSDSQSSPLKALKYLSTACGLSSEVFDPTNKCVTVKQYLSEMDSALKGAHSLFVATDLGECVTGVMMVKIWGGVTVVMQSWGKLEERNLGLAQVEEGVGYALTRPGLFTFPMWWHALHCAAVTLAHFGRSDIYMRLRATFNKHTFPGTEMPPIDTYTPGSVCPQLGGSCSKLAYWLQVRGTMCGEPEWKPHFTKNRLPEASENAAYAMALDRGNCMGNSCSEKANGAAAQGMAQALRPSQPKPMNGADLVDGSPVRAALDAGLNEISTNFDDLSGLEALAGAELDLDLNLNPLGVEFDLSQLIQEPENADKSNLDSNPEAEAYLEACHAGGEAGIAAGVREGEPLPVSTGTENMPMNTMQTPLDLVPGRGIGAARGAGAVAPVVSGAAAPVITGGGEMSRETSFGISGPAAVRWSGAAPVVSSAGQALSRQSSIDINTLMQMANSDEELKKKEGGTPDAIDDALAFGEGPAKEIFGVELSKP
eukprot:g11219.t1